MAKELFAKYFSVSSEGEGAAVYVYDVSDYENMRLFLNFQCRSTSIRDMINKRGNPPPDLPGDRYIWHKKALTFGKGTVASGVFRLNKETAS